MERARSHISLDLGVRALLIVVLAIVAGAACNNSSSTAPPPPDPGPFQLTFSLDATFQAPHGGQPIAVAIVRASDGSVVLETPTGTVSATQDPSFTWSTGPVMQAGIDYEVHYWIDSNLGGGTLGVCDPKAIDHQWSVEFPAVANDKDQTVSHNEDLTEDVCGTFD